MPEEPEDQAGMILPDIESPQVAPAATRRGEMSFLDHLEDLRQTVIRSTVAFALGCLLVGMFLKPMAQLLNWPMQRALGTAGGLIVTSPLGVFTVALQLVVFGGLALALPFMLYFFSRFLAPALTPRELKVLRPACLMIFLLFLIGAAFSFFVLVPAALTASKALNDVFGFQVLWTADRYYGLLLWMTLGVGLTFEFPLLLLVLVYVGVLSQNKLRDFRPYSIVIFMAVSAVVTPTTDPVTFLFLAAPLQVLYEISIHAAGLVERARVRREEMVGDLDTPRG